MDDYEPLQKLQASTNSRSGARFYTSQDHGSLPNPGSDGVLASALPYWNDYVRVTAAAPPGCLSTSAELMPDLGAAWGSAPVQCQLAPNQPTCSHALHLRKAIPSSGGSSEVTAGAAQIMATRIADLSITLRPFPI